MSALTTYDIARAAIAQATAIQQIVPLIDEFEVAKLRAKQIKDQALLADATEFQMRAERRLGEVLAQAKAEGLFRQGRQKEKKSDEPTFSRPTLQEAGIDKYLSQRAQGRASISEQAFDAMVRATREQIAAGKARIINEADGKRTAETRRQLAQELSDCAALQATGRKFPVLYADPAWQRKAGIGNRAYENHYVTMTWADILAMPVKDRLLPDAWGFVWMPRAHLLAPVETEIDTPLGRCTMKIPLAWAIQIKWGFDSYSTLFVWTKTDEECPDDHGLGLIAWDQDEILLLFKRSRGLPKPDTDKKYGSNHRERASDHSAKPNFYRQMIVDMTNGVPVLELFAREDDAHVFPPNFFTWGNQSKNSAELPAHDPETGELIEEQNAADQSSPQPHHDRPVRNAAVNSSPDDGDREPASLAHGDAGSPFHEDDVLEIPAFLRGAQHVVNEGSARPTNANRP